MPVDTAVAETVDRLVRAGCVAAEAEARELHEHAPDRPTLGAWVDRRTRGEPLAWITGTTTFGDLRLWVESGVYVPRPHTRELATRAMERLPTGGRALDVCTGTGAVAACLRAQDPTAHVVATDLDPRAAACARRNGVPTVVSDLADAVAGEARWDVVTAVAPYVPTDQLRFLPADVQRYEPLTALDGGDDGLDLVRRIVAAASRLLGRDGWLLVEIGGHQDEGLAVTLDRAGFDRVDVWSDDFDDPRGLAARRA